MRDGESGESMADEVAGVGRDESELEWLSESSRKLMIMKHNSVQYSFRNVLQSV